MHVKNGDQNDNSAQYAGAAYVFTRAGAAWSLQQKLWAAETSSDDQFGFDVAIDGDAIVVGAPRTIPPGVGAAYVFRFNGATWTQQDKLEADDLEADIALVGGLGAWGFGLWLANHEESWPAFLKTPTATRALDAVRRGYEQHGSMYLATNRFLPALRAFFFVGAGLSRMSAGAVVLYGGISALLWNALLMGAGYAVGNNWDALREIAERYTVATLILVVVVVVGVVARFLYDARRP